MNEWCEGTLADIAEIIMGQSPKGESCNTNGNGSPLLNGPTEFGVKYPNPVQYTIDAKKFSRPNDILFCVRGSTTGRMNWSDQIYALGRGLAAIRHKEGQKYKYFIRGIIDFNLPVLLASATGSTFPNVSRDQLENLELSTPPLPEQKAIASVLSSLDDKIDLLHRQNKTLEAMAETLFRQWFIEEAQEDWEVRPLGEFVTVKRGGSPRPIQEYLSETGFRWLKISDATKTASPFIFEIKEHIKEEGLNKTTLLKAGTLVLSNSATPGIPKILQIDSCIHDGWLHFPKSHFSNEFLYLLFKKIRPELLNQGNGSIFTNLKTDILKEYPIPIADDESLLLFDNQIKPIFDKLLKNTTQIQTLEKLRDTLLPRLMSGEVRIQCDEELIA